MYIETYIQTYTYAYYGVIPPSGSYILAHPEYIRNSLISSYLSLKQTLLWSIIEL